MAVSSGSPVSRDADHDESAVATTVDFGNSETLDKIRRLTDVGAMTRLLHECVAYQRSLDIELEGILSQRSEIERQLTGLLKSAEILEIVRADADHMLSSIQSTCDLADQVSSKVRELDLAQSL